LTIHSGREADHSPPSSAEVKEWVELYLHSPSTPSRHGAQLWGAQEQLYFYLYLLYFRTCLHCTFRKSEPLHLNLNLSKTCHKDEHLSSGCLCHISLRAFLILLSFYASYKLIQSMLHIKDTYQLVIIKCCSIYSKLPHFVTHIRESQCEPDLKLEPLTA
jgi:hypothetical protein